jgi:hypothetical protein
MRHLIEVGVAGCALVLSACAAHKAPATAPERAAGSRQEAAAPLPSGTVGTNLVTVTAVVQKINLKTRHVTLGLPDGTTTTMEVDKSVRNLPQVKKGDEVNVTFSESLAYQVLKPGEGAPGAQVAEDVRRAQLGAKPGASVARVQTVTATIEAIDKSAETATLRGPGGRRVTVKVRNPKNLDRVSVGDLVELTYTEALAIRVEKPGGESKK